MFFVVDPQQYSGMLSIAESVQARYCFALLSLIFRLGNNIFTSGCLKE